VALDENNNVILSSVDLTAAFNLVGGRLFICDYTLLSYQGITVGKIDENTYILLDILWGVIQGSIIGPI
jgi:hypothetical protein